MPLQFIVPRYYTVVLETFDGHQYGLLSLCVEACSEEEAKQDAVAQAVNDGWQRVKVQMVT